MDGWTFSFRDDHGDYTEVVIAEEQARAFMRGEAVTYWPDRAPESVRVDDETGWLHVRHDARASVPDEDPGV
jgi:hypothetical protein